MTGGDLSKEKKRSDHSNFCEERDCSASQQPCPSGEVAILPQGNFSCSLLPAPSLGKGFVVPLPTVQGGG